AGAAGDGAHADRVAAFQDAYVAHDAASDVWTIGSAAAAISFGFGAGRQWQLWQIADGAGRPWAVARDTDTSMTIGAAPTTLSTIGTGLAFAGVAAEATSNGVLLEVDYTRSDVGARVRRFYVCYPHSPVVETWTRVETTATRAIGVADLVTWRATIATGTIHWLNGLQGDSADASNDNAFAAESRDLTDTDELVLGSERRSSERQVPVAIVDGLVDGHGGGSEFVVGSMWSGPWRMVFAQRNGQLSATLGYPGLATTASAGQPLETPHAFFGVTPGDQTNVASALRPFVDNGLRSGRAFTPLVTYNTWFAYGVQMDAGALQEEMSRDRDLGVELFVVDAGWYATPGATGPSDFEAGLGAWQADPARFPGGLRPLRDAAHALGMKFGVWVEPERLNQALINQSGCARDSWLATSSGRYGSARTAQICFGSRAARAWVLQQLVALVDTVQPDYLKWDNNFWISCDRTDHDHGVADGAFAHVQGLYEVLGALRAKYPDLLIENVSGGGNRLDFGWLRYSDTAWMDDRTSPSSHVRRNVEGLATLFPPAYLLAFALDSPRESIVRGDDVPLYLRSRAAGVLGLTFHGADLPDGTRDAVRDAARLFSAVRDIGAGASAVLLTPPADPSDTTRWDALEELDASSGNAVVFAFRGDAAPDWFTVSPRNLVADATYEVWSADAGLIGTARGADLMANGIAILDAGGSRAHVLKLLTAGVAGSNKR
ncbi:MAG: glycoside hydrolase family 36 protein, partial [Vicinamibacterales bacterium]